MPKTKNVTVRLTNEQVKLLDESVDGIQYRSRAHLIANIIAEWTNRKAKKKR